MSINFQEMVIQLNELKARQERDELVIKTLREQVQELAKPAVKLTFQEQQRRQQIIEAHMHAADPANWGNAAVYVWVDGKHITVRRCTTPTFVCTYTEIKNMIRQRRDQSRQIEQQVAA